MTDLAPTGRPNTKAAVVTFGALWALLALWCLRPIWGIDIFFHIAIGRHALAGTLTGTDLFSAADANIPWAPFQIGYEVLVAALHDYGSMEFLRAVHAIALGGALALAWRRFGTLTRSPVAAALLLLLLLVTFEERIRMRPHIVNLLFEAAFLLPVARWRFGERVGRDALIATLIGLAWTTMHAMGALWFIAVLGTHWVGGPTSAIRRGASIAVIAALVGVIIAPGAIEGIAHVLAIQGEWGPFVPELAPSWAWFAEGHFYGVFMGVLPLLATFLVLGAAATNPRRERWPVLLSAAGLSIGAIAMVRLSYYSVFALALIAPELAQLSRRLTIRASAWRPVGLLVSLGLLGLLLAHSGPRLLKNPGVTTLWQPGAFPRTEVAMLQRAGIGGRIFNETEWGGYLLYALHPPSTVFSDGRVTFMATVGAYLLDDRDPKKRVSVAHHIRGQYGIDLMVRRRGVFPEGEGWSLLIRGPVADVWSSPGPVFERRVAALNTSENPPAP